MKIRQEIDTEKSINQKLILGVKINEIDKPLASLTEERKEIVNY